MTISASVPAKLLAVRADERAVEEGAGLIEVALQRA
jgi:hypothetical protein